jgi:deoxyxylulose-5-phosphate synthase
LGYGIVKGGLFGNPMRKEEPKMAIISYGYMLGRCLDVQDKFLNNNMEVSLYNMSKIKPNPLVKIREGFSDYNKIVTVEEQTLSGGFGSAVLEGMSDNNVQKPLLRIGLPERYIFENGDRDYHLDNNGLSVDSIYDKVLKFRSE